MVCVPFKINLCESHIAKWWNEYINYSLRALCHPRTSKFDCKITVLRFVLRISSYNSFYLYRVIGPPIWNVWSKVSWSYAQTHKKLISQENMDNFYFLQCSGGSITTLSNMANIFYQRCLSDRRICTHTSTRMQMESNATYIQYMQIFFW